MHKGAEVLKFLVGNNGWSIHGEDFDSIKYDEGIKPITLKEFEDGLVNLDAWKAEQEAESESKRQAALTKLAALGLTGQDLEALGL